MVLTTNATDPLLDLPLSVGQRQATFRFDLVDGVTGQPLGQIHPIRDTVPTLTHDTTRTTKRSIDNILFAVADTNQINPLADRVLVSMVIGGTTWPLGRYMFSNQIISTTTSGNQSSASLVDEMFLIDQEISAGFTKDGSVDQAVRALLFGLPLVGVTIEASGFPAIGAWAVGTRRGQILDALSVQGDYASPWMANSGFFMMVRTVDPATAVPDFDFDNNRMVVRATTPGGFGGPTRTSDVLNAPNRFIVNSNAGGTPLITGQYDVPASAPHSIQNRGFVIADVETLQVANNSQAAAAAQTLGIRGTIYDRIQLATPPDPRHDSYDVIRWQGENWLELGWSLPLIEGAEMVHTMRKAYS